MADRHLQAADAMDMARAVGTEAADMLRDAAGSARTVRAKSTARDPVTEWDTRCEALIRARLHALTPQVPILGEEQGAQPAARPGHGAAGHRDQWVIDPIDGTVNFLHGLPIFCVSIALERDGQAIAGVVHAPALGWEFYGHLGGGAFLSGAPMAVSQVERLDRALLSTGFPYDRATNPDNNFARWEHFQRAAGACRRLGSAALDLCMVACGWLDGYWERGIHAWDVAAGALLVREAGGAVTRWDGSPFASDQGEVLATNRGIHEEMIAGLAAADQSA